MNSGLRNKLSVTDVIKNEVTEYIAQGIFPGAAFAFVEGFEPAHEIVVGQAAIMPEIEELSADRLWDLASVSKVVGVGTVLIDRILSGELSADAPLQSLLPSWHEETVTLRQLLTHTSGISPVIENRDKLTKEELIAAMLTLTVIDDKRFRYTDVNFILLGLALEELDGKPLDVILSAEVFDKWQMSDTSFAPVSAERAISTDWQLPRGVVHDPKARVLGNDCGSAGLFSTVSDLTRFVQGYFANPIYLALTENFAATGDVPRSLAWAFADASQDWLIHTGYTGTFILMNLKRQQAVIFMSNRVHLKDERAQWIVDRDRLIQKIILKIEEST